MSQNGPALRGEPKRTSSTPWAKADQLCAVNQSGPVSAPWAKTDQLCAVNQNGPALLREPKRTSSARWTKADQYQSSHRAGNLQPLRRRPPHTGSSLYRDGPARRHITTPLEILHKPKQNLEEEVLSWSIQGTLIQKSLPFMVMCLSHPAVKNLILYLIDDWL